MDVEQRRMATFRRPLFVGGLTAAAVTATAMAFPWWVALGLSALLSVWFLCRRNGACALLVLVCLLSTMGYRHLYVAPADEWDGQTATLSGVVVGEPANGAMYTVRVTSSDVLRRGSKVMLYCVGETAPQLHDRIEAAVRIYSLSDRQTTYAAEGAFVCAFPDAGERDVAVVGSRRAPLSRVLSRCRRALVAVVRRRLGTQESGMLSAICFGESAVLEDTVTAAFRGSGLSHLLVVSGLHLTMVALMARLVTRRLGRCLSTVLTVVLIWLFTLFVGGSPSVLRAAVMSTLWLLGNLCFCRADGLNSLGFAALLLLVAQPYALLDVSFQLSFAATLGVLLMLPQFLTDVSPVERDLPCWVRLWLWLKRTVLDGTKGCVAALLFTSPIAVYHFGSFSLTSLPANVLAVPPLGAAMMLGWLGALVGLVPFLGWLSSGILFMARGIVVYIGGVARLFAASWAQVTFAYRWQWLLLAGLCTILVCGLLCRISAPRLLAGVSAVAVLSLCVGLPLTNGTPRLTVVPLEDEAGIVIRQGHRCALLLTSLDELDELTYASAPADVDVVLVGDGSAASVRQLDRFPMATTLTTCTDLAAVADGAVPLCPVGSTITLWEGYRLQVLTADCWLLQMGEDTMHICTAPHTSCAGVVAPTIAVGGVPSSSADGTCIVVYGTDLLPHTLTSKNTLVYERSITLTPVRGEWRILPWL